MTQDIKHSTKIGNNSMSDISNNIINIVIVEKLKAKFSQGVWPKGPIEITNLWKFRLNRPSQSRNN